MRQSVFQSFLSNSFCGSEKKRNVWSHYMIQHQITRDPDNLSRRDFKVFEKLDLEWIALLWTHV